MPGCIDLVQYVRERLVPDPTATTSLELAHLGIGDEPNGPAAKAVLELLSSELPLRYMLRTLDLSYNSMLGCDIARLLQRARECPIESVNLRGNRLGVQASNCISALAGVVYADLAYNCIDAEAAQLLSQTPSSSLRILDLSGNDLSADCHTLCSSTSLAALEELVLRDCSIGQLAASRLIEEEANWSVKLIDLLDNPISEFSMVHRGGATELRLSEQPDSGRLGQGRALECDREWRAERQVLNWKVGPDPRVHTLSTFRSCDWRVNADLIAFGLPHERQAQKMDVLQASIPIDSPDAAECEPVMAAAAEDDASPQTVLLVIALSEQGVGLPEEEVVAAVASAVGASNYSSSRAPEQLDDEVSVSLTGSSPVAMLDQLMGAMKEGPVSAMLDRKRTIASITRSGLGAAWIQHKQSQCQRAVLTMQDDAMQDDERQLSHGGLWQQQNGKLDAPLVQCWIKHQFLELYNQADLRKEAQAAVDAVRPVPWSVMEFDSVVALTSLALIEVAKVPGHPGWPRGAFYCLGSHSGRSVVAAALLEQFQTAVGIEPCEGLHKMAQEAAIKFNRIVPVKPGQHRTGISFLNSDMECEDWPDALVVMITARSISRHVLAQKVLTLQRGAVVVVPRRMGFASSAFREVCQRTVQMNWGTDTYVLYLKTV